MRHLFAAILLILTCTTALAEMTERDGWAVTRTTKPFGQLVDDVKSAAKANKMGVVTQAGPTGAAKKRGITIPGNRVLGVFRNDFAVDIIRADPAAMIAAPVRIMVMEEPDGTASMSYKLPSTVFAPYTAGGATVSDAAAQMATLGALLDRLALACDGGLALGHGRRRGR